MSDFSDEHNGTNDDVLNAHRKTKLLEFGYESPRLVENSKNISEVTIFVFCVLLVPLIVTIGLIVSKL